MVNFNLAVAVKMVLQAPYRIEISPADTVKGVYFERPDGTALKLMYMSGNEHHMEAIVTLPNTVTGEPIEGTFSLSQACSLVQDFIAGHNMIYDEVIWPSGAVASKGVK